MGSRGFALALDIAHVRRAVSERGLLEWGKVGALNVSSDGAKHIGAV